LEQGERTCSLRMRNQTCDLDYQARFEETRVLEQELHQREIELQIDRLIPLRALSQREQERAAGGGLPIAAPHGRLEKVGRRLERAATHERGREAIRGRQRRPGHARRAQRNTRSPAAWHAHTCPIERTIPRWASWRDETCVDAT